MKILLDQNISFRVAKKIKTHNIKLIHLKEHRLIDKTDFVIWDYIKNNNFLILTFDFDFIEIANLWGAPPKIIPLKTANLNTYKLIELLKRRIEIIETYISDKCLKILQIYNWCFL